MVFLLSLIVKYYFVVAVVVVAVVVAAVSFFEILFTLCSDLSLLLVYFCSVRLLVKLFVCLASGLALTS